MPCSETDELAFDIPQLRARLQKEREVGRCVIVVHGLGEVNTGGFGGDINELADACEEGNAWLHVDAGESKAIFYQMLIG